MPRDSQRTKLYRAEDRFLVAFGKWDSNKMSIEECQEFLDSVLSQKWFIQRYGHPLTKVTAARRDAKRSWGQFGGDMKLTEFGRYKGLIIHELAHCLQDAFSDLPAHSPEFCGRYATLVFHVFGREAETLLLEGYAEKRIKHTY